MTAPAPPEKRRKILLWVGFAVAIVVLLGVVPFALLTFLDDNADSGLPAKPADYVGNDPGMPTTNARNFGNGLGALIGPHFALRFTTVEVSRTLSYQYEAAPGHEFLLLTIDPATLADAPGPDDDVTAAVVVDSAGYKTSVAAIQRGYGLVVSVATGHTALLKITDTGRTQTLDLRTGKRASDEIQGYYPERALNLSPTTYAQSGKTTSGGCRRQTTMTIDFIGAGTGTAVLPWGPDVGWAKPGRAWLPINYTMLTNPMSVPDYDTLFDLPPACTLDLNFQLDPKQTFAVEFDGGTATPVKVTDHLLLFDVPVTMTGGTLVVHPAGSFNDGNTHPVVWSEPPPDGRIALVAAK